MFQLSPGDGEKIDHWLKTEVYPEIVAQQKLDPQISQFIYQDESGNAVPYFGAIGGDLTYSFTPTSLGTIIKVECFNKQLDLTAYDEW